MKEAVVKDVQQQALASWIDYLKFERIRALYEALADQDINFENAMKELQKLRDFIGDPSHILGSDATKHGEIAENMQVYISNAKRIVEGLKGLYTFDGVGRTAPEDYLFDGSPVQQKFYNGAKHTVEAVKKHLDTYPDFLKSGGSYDIPKDQYEYIVELLKKPSSQLSRSEATLVKVIREWEEKNGISFTDKVKSAITDYAEVQAGKADSTVNQAEKDIKDRDKKQRDNAFSKNKPTLKEGAAVTAVSAAVEGGLQLALAVREKLKSGKKLFEFTEEDWKEIGITTAKSTGTGAFRGAGTYVLTNFANMSGTVANGYITSAVGMASQACKYHNGEIDSEEFLINSQVVCLDASISVIGAAIGQALIPVFILGPVIGASVANFMAGIAKDNLSKREQELIDKFNKEMKKLADRLSADEKKIIDLLDKEYQKFNSLAELAFDPDVNVAFAGSIQLAGFVNVKDSRILKTKEDIDSYFTD